MQYNDNLKGNADSAISNAITRINACKKSTNIKIPSDFAGAGTIRTAIEMINGVSLSGIQREFKGAISELEANESEEKARAVGFKFNLRGSNLSRSNRSTIGIKNAKHIKEQKEDWRTEMEKEKKVRHRYAIEAKTQKQWIEGIEEDHNYMLNHPDIYRYGNSNTFPPCEWEIGLDGKPVKYTASNRLVSRQLYEWGYKDMGRRRTRCYKCGMDEES